MDRDKLIKSIKIGDIILAKSFAGPNVSIRVTKTIFKNKDESGASGCFGIMINPEDIKKLISKGVPYKDYKDEEVWVFDFEIIKKERRKNTNGGRRRIVRN